MLSQKTTVVSFTQRFQYVHAICFILSLGIIVRRSGMILDLHTQKIESDTYLLRRRTWANLSRKRASSKRKESQIALRARKLPSRGLLWETPFFIAITTTSKGDNSSPPIWRQMPRKGDRDRKKGCCIKRNNFKWSFQKVESWIPLNSIHLKDMVQS